MTFGGNKLYVGNFFGQSVTTCDWVSATNTSTGCVNTVNTDIAGSAAGLVTYSLSTGTSYLFVSQLKSIYRCTIASGNGALSNCIPTGVTVSSPQDQ